MTKKRTKNSRGGPKSGEDGSVSAEDTRLEEEISSEEPTAEEGVGSDVPEAPEGAGGEEESALEQALRERDEYLELARKTRAELENYRRRVVRDREIDKQRHQGDLLRELLNPLDDFERALKHAEEEKCFDTLYEGLTMVRDAIWKAIATTGFERIPGNPGTSFDPNVHDAMMQIPHPEHPQNVIVDEIASGYKLGDMVLRASKVVVSSGTPSEPTAVPDSSEEKSGDGSA